MAEIGAIVARILMAWELGAGYGHLAPMLTLAVPLRAAGHEVAFAVRDTTIAERVLGKTGIRFFQAPANFATQTGQILRSFPQILAATAFNDALELRGRVRAWRSLYKQLGTDVVVVDHSPTALLAARGLDVKCVVTGTGFVMPPAVAPMPDLRPWLEPEPETLARDETRMLDLANGVLDGLSAPRLERIGQLFSGDAQALFTLRELDPYADTRQKADYLGPLMGQAAGARPEWPSGSGKRVFFYARPFESMPAMLQILRESGHTVLAYVAQLSLEKRAQFENDRLRFANALMDMEAVAAECDCAVLTSGHGTTAALLLAGKPVFLLPQYLEMFLIANAVVAAGAGLSAPKQKPEGMREKFQRLLQDASFAAKAREFSERYRGKVSGDSARARFLATIERLLGAP